MSEDPAISEPPSALAADDHPVNRRLIASQLASFGFVVDTVNEGRAVLDRVRARAYELVVLDCAMPGMHGFDVARGIRHIEADARRTRSFVVACTASAAVDVERHCLAAGMDDCIVKPSTIEALSRSLQRRFVLTPRVGASAAPTVPTAPAPIDLDMMAQSFGAGAAIAGEMLRDFVAINAEDLHALHEALCSADAGGVRRCAHRMLGASKMIGAAALARATGRLEAVAASGDWQRVAALASVVRHECTRIERFVAGMAAA